MKFWPYSTDNKYNAGVDYFNAGRYTEAIKCFLELAERKHPTACLMLGRICEEGLGVKVDLDAAKLWYSYAAEGGEGEAVNRLNRIWKRLELTNIERTTDKIDGQYWKTVGIQQIEQDNSPVALVNSFPQAAPSSVSRSILRMLHEVAPN